VATLRNLLLHLITAIFPAARNIYMVSPTEEIKTAQLDAGTVLSERKTLNVLVI
jgi:2-phospho-L-lactate guanylyltransferase (CobY/MobA/RfbA family)